jgi:hypothetical protein
MKARQSRGSVNSVSSLVIIATFLFANVLCVAPRLHEKIHKPSPNHECAVTLIASGKYELSDAPPLIFAPQPAAQFSKIPTLSSTWVAVPFLDASIFEHAPPASS